MLRILYGFALVRVWIFYAKYLICAGHNVGFCLDWFVGVGE